MTRPVTDSSVKKEHTRCRGAQAHYGSPQINICATCESRGHETIGVDRLKLVGSAAHSPSSKDLAANRTGGTEEFVA